MLRKKLIKKIKKIFLSSEYPGDDFINNDTDYDFDTDFFIGKKWIDIDADSFLNHYNAIHFFKKEGFEYYLPCYLIFLLECDDDFISDKICYFIDFILKKYIDNDNERIILIADSFKDFNTAKWECISDFCKIVINEWECISERDLEILADAILLDLKK